VRQVMRENGLPAPHRVGRTETRPHDGTIITDKVNEMWGTDMTQTGGTAARTAGTAESVVVASARDDARHAWRMLASTSFGETAPPMGP
jgi:hypothetical protein